MVELRLIETRSVASLPDAAEPSLGGKGEAVATAPVSTTSFFDVARNRSFALPSVLTERERAFVVARDVDKIAPTSPAGAFDIGAALRDLDANFALLFRPLPEAPAQPAQEAFTPLEVLAGLEPDGPAELEQEAATPDDKPAEEPTPEQAQEALASDEPVTELVFPDIPPDERTVDVGALALDPGRGLARLVGELPNVFRQLTIESEERFLEEVQEPFTPGDILTAFSLFAGPNEKRAAFARMLTQFFGTKPKLASSRALVRQMQAAIRANRAALEAMGLTPSDPDNPLSRLLFDIGAGVGSVGASVGVTLITRNPAYAALLFGAIQKTALYEEARKAGFSPGDAGRLSTLGGLLQGALEATGGAIFLRLARQDKQFTRILTRALQQSGEEGAQQAAEEILTQGSGVRDVDVQGGLADVAYAAALGFIVGGKVSAVVELAAGVAAPHGVSREQAEQIVEALAGAPEQLQAEGADLLEAAANPEQVQDEAAPPLKMASADIAAAGTLEQVQAEAAGILEGLRSNISFDANIGALVRFIIGLFSAGTKIDVDAVLELLKRGVTSQNLRRLEKEAQERADETRRQGAEGVDDFDAEIDETLGQGEELASDAEPGGAGASNGAADVEADIARLTENPQEQEEIRSFLATPEAQRDLLGELLDSFDDDKAIMDKVIAEKKLNIGTEAAIGLRHYTDPEFAGELNKKLREGRATLTDKKLAMLIAKGLRGLQLNKGEIWRAPRQSAEAGKQFWASAVVGEPLAPDLLGFQFQSFTTDKAVAACWSGEARVVIHAKSTPRGANIEKLSRFPEEREVLLQPGLAYRVVDKRTETFVLDDGAEIDLRIIEVEIVDAK